jgi:hypothetical protein
VGRGARGRLPGRERAPESRGGPAGGALHARGWRAGGLSETKRRPRLRFRVAGLDCLIRPRAMPLGDMIELFERDSDSELFRPGRPCDSESPDRDCTD